MSMTRPRACIEQTGAHTACLRAWFGLPRVHLIPDPWTLIGTPGSNDISHPTKRTHYAVTRAEHLSMPPLRAEVVARHTSR